VNLYLVHHADAVGPDVDPRRPLSPGGIAHAERVAAEAAARGAKPEVVWHSGKLRARQTAETFWRACNALAELSATRDLQPTDQPAFMRDRLRGESRDVMLVGHFFHLPMLFALLTGADRASFPQHGIVALQSEDEGETWTERWRIS
jgi:phosphohistidine phosphatase